MIYLAFAAFVMMVLQSLLTYFQYRNYQKAVDSMREKGKILGIGLRKGGFSLRGGSIVILGLNRNTQRIVDCQKLEGIAMWKRFEVTTRYDGLSLEEVREVGIAEDYEINRRRREKEAYSPGALDKKRKKGALIQAVEALDKRLSNEASATRYQEQRDEQRKKTDKNLVTLAQ